MIDYYTRVAPVLLPHLRGRALTLKRYPERGGRRVTSTRSRSPRTRPSGCGRSRSRRATARSTSCSATTCPRWSGWPTWPTWSCTPRWRWPRTPTPRPCWPSTSTRARPPALAECCEVALLLRDTLAQLGLECYAEDLGLEGHADLRAAEHATSTYDDTKPFAHGARQAAREAAPEAGRVGDEEGAAQRARSSSTGARTTATRPRSGVYSLRARERPTVSTPLTLGRGRGRATRTRWCSRRGELLERVDGRGRPVRAGARREQELPDL